MRALVTGGAGFIGSHLAETLLEEGHKVHVVDDLSTGTISNISTFEAHPSFTFTQGSVGDAGLMDGIVEDCDVVFHLAAAVGVKLAVESPVHTIQTNVDGTGTLLALAREKVRKVLIASTSEVYGDIADSTLVEDAQIVLYPAMKSRWSYAWSKAIAEFLAIAHWHEHKTPVVVLRLFNTVGPRQTGRYGMVLPRFVEQALAGEPVTIHGDGNQTRCFAHVKDVVRGMIDLSEHPDAVGHIFNIGNDVETTIGSLARMVLDITNSSSELVHIPYDQVYGEGFEDMQRRVPDLNKIRNLIGYKVTHDLPAIVQAVADQQSER